MAVVKSPKNIKRKPRWIVNFARKNRSKLVNTPRYKVSNKFLGKTPHYTHVHFDSIYEYNYLSLLDEEEDWEIEANIPGYYGTVGGSDDEDDL